MLASDWHLCFVTLMTEESICSTRRCTTFCCPLAPKIICLPHLLFTQGPQFALTWQKLTLHKLPQVQSCLQTTKGCRCSNKAGLLVESRRCRHHTPAWRFVELKRQLRDKTSSASSTCAYSTVCAVIYRLNRAELGNVALSRQTAQRHGGPRSQNVKHAYV